MTTTDFTPPPRLCMTAANTSVGNHCKEITYRVTPAEKEAIIPRSSISYYSGSLKGLSNSRQNFLLSDLATESSDKRKVCVFESHFDMQYEKLTTFSCWIRTAKHPTSLGQILGWNWSLNLNHLFLSENLALLPHL